MKTSKKNQAPDHVRHFRECFSDFPVGSLMNINNSSFTVTSPGGKVTCIIHKIFATTFKELDLVDDEATDRSQLILDKAKQIFYKETGIHLFVDATFRASLRAESLAKKIQPHILTSARNIAAIVNKNLPGPGERKVLEQGRKGTKGLPLELEYLSIWRKKGISNGCWSSGFGIFIPPLNASNTQDLISSVEDLMDKFPENSKENWLLLTDNGTHGANAFDIRSKSEVLFQPYITKFDRVFLFRYLHSEVFELKTLHMGSND